jgi:VIT1/CCC1 family predicted Fe2+/Mn2+ transporter
MMKYLQKVNGKVTGCEMIVFLITIVGALCGIVFWITTGNIKYLAGSITIVGTFIALLGADWGNSNKKKSAIEFGIGILLLGIAYSLKFLA